MLLFHVSKGTEWRGRRVKGGGSYQWAGGCWLCALSGWRRVARCNGQEPRQPSSKVNRTASPSSPVSCLFCPLQAPPEKCWHTAAWLVLTPYKQACRLLIYVLALLLPWNCCHVLCWVGSAALAFCENPTGVAGLPLSTECIQFFHACCCRELWSRNLEDCFQRSCFPLPDSQ